LRLSTLGWYQVLQGEAYASVPGRSGTVMAITSAAGIIGGALIWFIGISANQFGLPEAMWMLLAAPICLLIFTPRSKTG
jgi:FSR family fosmidomycin resistance protein-like MFS transporter